MAGVASARRWERSLLAEGEGVAASIVMSFADSIAIRKAQDIVFRPLHNSSIIAMSRRSP
jgi:hypothetical protein